ncbi:MAG TPA: hypothetical protein VM487_19590, partial [Phycisphaerae bacterium]|nr:hypothetical protein [Phycisphaerae bacterium]
ALRASRIPYNEVIQRTTQEQLLLNLVRLRYREVPMFLEVGSVSAQFVFDESADVRGTLNENVPYQPINPDVLQLGARIGYQEKPTITFTPLQGEAFVNRLMSPLSLETILLLSRSGWRVDRVLRVTAQGMNGLDNASKASGPTPSQAPRYKRFARVCQLLRELQRDNLLELGYETRTTRLSDPIPAGALSSADMVAAARDGYSFRAAEEGDGFVLMGTEQVPVWRMSPRAAESAAADEALELLGLDPQQDRFELRVAAVQQPRSEAARGRRGTIDLSTRSLLGALFYLSQVVEVPESHRRRGYVTTTLDEEDQPFDWWQVMGDLLKVHCRAPPPGDAAVAVRYRGWWFYIPDDDLSSKSTFALLGQLFALQAGGAKSVPPVLTLPVGG